MTKDQYISICSWQRSTFGDATPLSKIVHLGQELMELAECLDEKANKIDTQMEFADCFTLLFGAADSYGMSYEDICQAIEDKMKINFKRKWGKPDANGVVNHVRDNSDVEDQLDFEACDDCDLHNACEDFGCAIKSGITQTQNIF